MPIIEGQELVDKMVHEMRSKIPEKLFNKVMDDMQRDGNCGVWTCCKLCVEELAEVWEEAQEHAEED